MEENQTISAEDILQETETIIKKMGDFEIAKANKILEEIITLLEPVDFRERCKLEEKEKVLRKHYLISCIEIVLETAKNEGFSLCRKGDLIYVFNSEYWENVEKESFKDFLGKAALKVGINKFESKHHLFKDDLFKQFLSDAGLEEIHTNNKTTLINLRNGTFEITSQNQFLREFRKEDFITYQLPFAYEENATMERFQNFLNEVLPEPELQQILCEYLGYIFIKNSQLKLEKVLLLFGSGANGKSVIFEILMALLGIENISNYSLQSLTSDNGYYRAMITNKLLNYASEINGKLEASIFKQLISGEPVEARLPYGNPFVMRDYARFMFNCNELPKEIEITDAFFRRFIILPFRVTIPPHKQDEALSKKIIDSELSGIFNWVLLGLNTLLLNKKFTSSDIVKNEVEQYKKESDSVLMFLEEECYKRSINFEISLQEIYQAYTIYCIENGYHKCAKKTLANRLRKNGYKFNRKSDGQYVNIEKVIETDTFCTIEMLDV